jgi:hypothetical protein
MMCSKQLLEQMLDELEQAQRKYNYLTDTIYKALLDDDFDLDDTVSYLDRLQQIAEME